MPKLRSFSPNILKIPHGWWSWLKATISRPLTKGHSAAVRPPTLPPPSPVGACTPEETAAVRPPPSKPGGILAGTTPARSAAGRPPMAVCSAAPRAAAVRPPPDDDAPGLAFGGESTSLALHVAPIARSDPRFCAAIMGGVISIAVGGVAGIAEGGEGNDVIGGGDI